MMRPQLAGQKQKGQTKNALKWKANKNGTIEILPGEK